jgi:hypothetical protein
MDGQGAMQGNVVGNALPIPFVASRHNSFCCKPINAIGSGGLALEHDNLMLETNFAKPSENDTFCSNPSHLIPHHIEAVIVLDSSLLSFCKARSSIVGEGITTMTSATQLAPVRWIEQCVWTKCITKKSLYDTLASLQCLQCRTAGCPSRPALPQEYISLHQPDG